MTFSNPTLDIMREGLRAQAANYKKPQFSDGSEEAIRHIIVEDAVPAQQRTKAFHSQATTRPQKGWEQLAQDKAMRDASTRYVGSTLTTKVLAAQTPYSGSDWDAVAKEMYPNQKGYAPNSGDERGWAKLHKVDVHHDVQDDDGQEKTYRAAHIKAYDRAANRYGYNCDTDTDHEYVANRKVYKDFITTAKEEYDIASIEELAQLAYDLALQGIDEEDLDVETEQAAANFAMGVYADAQEAEEIEGLAKLHAKVTYDLLPDEYDEEDFEQASEQAIDIIAQHLTEQEEVFIYESKEEACSMAQMLANHHCRPFFVNRVTPFDEKGRKQPDIYHVVDKKHYDNDDSRTWAYKLTHIANPKLRKLKEDEDSEYKGRKLRQNLSPEEKARLKTYGSVDYKSAGAKRKEKTNESDEGAERMNRMQGGITQGSWANWCETLRKLSEKPYNNKMWNSVQFKGGMD
jgi:hypothetical protein